MSKFYTEIADYYDYIFPASEQQVVLIRELAGNPPKDILDVASGSGGYSVRLTEMGYNVTAVDLDEKMIQSLKAKNSSIDAHVMNMLDIEKLGKNFDVIFCIGNSLVHLDNNNEVLKFLKACRSCLDPGGNGKLLIQVINFDRILEKNITSLPAIINEEVGLTFERYYEYLHDKHKIKFRTVLKADGREIENYELLHPIRSDDLLNLLQNAGFMHIGLYGNFSRENYDRLNSFMQVYVAE